MHRQVRFISTKEKSKPFGLLFSLARRTNLDTKSHKRKHSKAAPPKGF